MTLTIKMRVAVCLLYLALNSCTLIPDYQQPELPVPETLSGDPDVKEAAISPGASAEALAEVGWSDFFIDPTLRRLIGKALDVNRDLRVSALNVAAYQAQYRVQRSALFPAIDGDASFTKQRTLSGGIYYATSEIYQVKVGMTAYELDFFGRLRSLEQKTLEKYLATVETHRSAGINLVAEVAAVYLTWLADRELLAISEDTRIAEEDSFKLIEQRVKVGIANELDLAQARTSLETVKANLVLYKRRVAQDVNYLRLLTGTDVTRLSAPNDGLLGEQMMVVDVPAQLPSQVLLQRPDIMAAEHELKGANADIGAARAAFFPSISLTANAGFISTELEKQFDGGSGMWLFSPVIRLPIFTAGRLNAELDAAQIRKDIAVARYENSIQVAFRETADALVAASTYREQSLAQKANLKANEDYHQMARQRYQQGLDSFLLLLDAQRSLYNARQNYLTLKLAQLVNQVTLYKVLGGGWKEGS